MASIVVTDFDGLKSALESDTNDITTVYLGADIEYTSSGGITISKAKGNIVIDGINPDDPSGYMHSLTDRISASAADVMKVPLVAAAGGFEIRLQNLIFIGRDYYGMVHVLEGGNNLDTTLSLVNVHYSGPQATRSRSSTVYVRDSSFLIDKLNGSTIAPEEFVETNKLIFEGNVDIDNRVATNSCCWMTGNAPEFAVMPGANVNISVPNNYMIYADGGPVDMSFGENSRTQISTKTGMFYTTGIAVHCASDFIVQRGASLSVTQSARKSGVGSIRCQQNFHVREGAELEIIIPYTPSDPLIQFTQLAIIDFLAPKSLVLYNKGGNIFGFRVAGNDLHIQSDQISLWNAAADFPEAGGIDDIPAQSWRLSVPYEVAVSATMSTSAMTSVVGSVSEDDEGGVMTTENFNLFTARVVSAGIRNLSIGEVTDSDRVITGSTDAGNNLKASYGSENVYGTAGADGSIALALPASATKGDLLTFKSNYNFLTRTVTAEVIGSVGITYMPDQIKFENVAAPARRSILKRQDGAWHIEVTDTRDADDGDWYLYATAASPLAAGGDTIENALVFQGTDQKRILSPVPVLLHKGSYVSDGFVTSISWNEIEGLLMELDPEFVYTAGIYTAGIDFFISMTEL